MQKRTKLLILSPVAERGGAERVMEDILEHMDRQQYEPHLVFFEDGTMVSQLRESGYRVDVLLAHRLRNMASYLKTVTGLRRIIRERELDAVVSWMPKAHLYGGVAAKLEGKPSVWWQHGIPDDRHWLDRLACAIPAGGIICPSNPSLLSQREMVSSKPVVLNHLGVNLKAFISNKEEGADFREQHHIPENATVFTFIGRLQYWKRPDMVIRAFNQVSADREAYLLILGGTLFGLEQNFESELRQLAEANVDPGRIRFLGHQNNVTPALSATDVVVHASTKEPFGMAIVESMAMKKTVIAVNRGGPSDVITHGVDGFLYNGTEEQLIPIMYRILNGEVSLGEIGHKARQTVMERFTVQNMTDQFENNLRQLLRLS
jgi:glycosyltransferase involved in cell wall biosynthesis